jgi:hypothetical protein
MAQDRPNDTHASNGSTEALREEIRQTRAELGETVQALSAKADVKARVKETATQTADRVKNSTAQTADRVKNSAAQTADRVKDSATHAAERARVSAYEARDLARRSPTPWFTIAGAAAVLAVILVVRGRRR